jgi:CRISPR-associated protein Cmr6
MIIKGLLEAAGQLGIEVDPNQPDSPKECCENRFDPKATRQIPMMYRAQIRGRCNLQYAGDNKDRDQWVKEWTRLTSEQQPCYQHEEPSKLGLDGATYRIKVEFPFRLFSNSGQDSILRPVLGKNGIPLIPGSSIKGLFLRVCQADDLAKNRSQEESLARKYCGYAEKPGILRFHGAYPIGNWSDRIVDVVHPQQNWQVRGRRENSETALALISLYKPQMIFEFSSSDPEFNGDDADAQWKKVEWLLLDALQKGIGGKTSTGYGLGGKFPGKEPITPRCPISAELNGVGISSVLLDGQPEFRANIFKAALRGHASRLLAEICSDREEVCSDENVVMLETFRLFGSIDTEGSVKILWQSQTDNDETPIYNVKGILYIDAPQSDIAFLEQLLQFTYTMGGFGKSWRRVWHKNFYNPIYNPNYSMEIGCHWSSPDFDAIQTTKHLKDFLDQLYGFCQRLRLNPSQSSRRMEAWTWNPKHVVVYSKKVSQSEVVNLFHDPTFKTTPAIGGRNLPPDPQRPRNNPPIFISSVWHRMLPIGNKQYLEIVTIFHGDRSAWIHDTEGNQLVPFIQELERRDLKLTWGENPIASR